MNDFSIDDTQNLEHSATHPPQGRSGGGWLAGTIGILIGMVLATAPLWFIASTDPAMATNSGHATPKLRPKQGRALPINDRQRGAKPVTRAGAKRNGA